MLTDLVQQPITKVDQLFPTYIVLINQFTSIIVLKDLFLVYRNAIAMTFLGQKMQIFVRFLAI